MGRRTCIPFHKTNNRLSFQGKIRVKICGLKYPDNIYSISELEPDFIGFIFHPGSPRFIGNNLSSGILERIPAKISKVGVFVNEEINTVIKLYNHYKLDYIQLHGDEDQVYCARLASRHVKIIKSFGVGGQFDFEKTESFCPHCRFFLFDTQCSQRGGSGLKFDWNILNRYKQATPFFLSGGIGPEDITNLKNLSIKQLYALDINSRFETKPGRKNYEQVKSFLNQIKRKSYA